MMRLARWVGERWAVTLQTWSQVGALIGMLNFPMMLGVFYTTFISTTLAGYIRIPFAVYIIAATLVLAGFITFVVKVGNPSWFGYAKRVNDIELIKRRLDEIEALIKELHSV